MLLHQVVTVTSDPTQDTADQYGRTLAYLRLSDGRDYSVTAAGAGTAHSYVFQHRPVSKAGEIAAAEAEAKSARRGLWGPPCNGDTASVPRPGK